MTSGEVKTNGGTRISEDSWFAMQERMGCWYAEVNGLEGELLPPDFMENEY